MKKFEYYVFFTICETSLKLFHKTHFLTYFNYCRTMAKSLNDDKTKLDKRELSDMMSMVMELKLIYDFDTETAVDYILKYFNSELCIDFQTHVTSIKQNFPLSFF